MKTLVASDGRDVYLPSIEPLSIVDLGCWQGVTTKVYADQYPFATIIGVELIEHNFNIAKKLLNKYSNVQLINTGVWSHDGEIECTLWASETSHIRATRVPQQGPLTMLKCSTLDTITSSLHRIDFIKFDIEAAEHEVLRFGGEWVDKTREIFIEIHDTTNDTIRNLVKDLGFTVTREEFEKIWASK